MKKYLSLVFLFAFTIIVFAQNTISGVVKNSEGNPVQSASVTVEEPGKDAIIAYSITNAKGEYKVTFTTSVSSVEVKIKAFNHKQTSSTLDNKTQTQNFTLQTEATEIEEVKLKTKLITKKGDTITYDINAFDTKNDRTLADVLKNMPGIEVNKDGSILYQGQALSKFYVNGKDLMEGGYGVVNNSLPKDAVRKVEVLENHQPVKILQDKVPSDQAAINVVLKNKVTMTGRGEVGTGFADPWLWNLKLTPMFFGQKNQWVLNYKTNNVGETVENEGNLFGFGSRWEGIRRAASQKSWLSVERANVPPLPEEKYLLNNVHFVSANILTNPFKNKEWELKVAGNYVNNAVERESYSERYDKQRDVRSTTTRFNNFYTNKAKGELIFTKNAKEGFFKNVTTFNQFWNADRANVDLVALNTDENSFSRQSIESPTTSFQNSLSTIIPLKSKMLNLMSFINYQDDNQRLNVGPGSYVYYPEIVGIDGLYNKFQNIETLRENFNLKTFEAIHSAKMGYTKKFWTFTPEVGFNYLLNDLLSELYGDFAINYGEDFSNDLKFSQSVPYVALGINYKNENWSLNFRMPTNFTSISIEDKSQNLEQRFNKATLEPSGFLQYSFASFWKAYVSGNINYNFANVGEVYSGLIMTNATSFSAMDPANPISESLAKRIGSRVEYRNPLNNLFFNLNYSYSTNKNNLMPDFSDNGLGFGVVRYQERDNKSESHSQRAEIGKYFPKLKSNVSFSFNNSNSVSEGLRNTIYYENENSTQSLGFKLNNATFDWMTFDYNFTLGWGKNENIFANTKNESYNHNFNVIFYPVEDHSIGFNWDQINNSQAEQTFTNGFYDLTYQFAWSKKKIDFELKWINIANKKWFEQINDSSTTTTLSRMQIRPSQVMATVKFNFK